MKCKNTTRKALYTSILSLLLCVSMLVGTTFAWFTDQVVSGMNTIAAGNLDVELFHSNKNNPGAYVDAETKLFSDVTRWEPGVVVYENFRVENVGDLALKYQLSIKFENETKVTVDGVEHGLSEVLKVAVVENGFEGGRAEAQNLKFDKSLSTFKLTGVLEGNTTSKTYGIVVYWAPNSNDVDNIFNMNNEKDGVLSIDLGVSLVAVQEMYEKDSFGDDYDEGLVLPDVDDEVLVEKDGIQYYYDENGNNILYLVTERYTGDTVNVPEGVDAIGNYAFAYNSNVETVVLSSTVRDLGRGFDSSSVKKVVLNEGLEVISSRAFRSTTALEEVVIPSTVKVIEDNAFQKSSIKNIVIPATVETIGEAAFGASLIETVTFLGNTSIQGYAFRDCTKLHTVTMKGEDVNFIPSTLNGRNSMWFCNGESNNPNTSNITFYVVNETVASRVKTAMGAEANNTPVYIIGSESNTIYVTVKNIEEFQNALDNATDTTIISFTNDINGDAIATQKAGVNITIDGAQKKFNGVMTVFGNGNQSGVETLTIKNIDFVAANGADSCIVSPDRTVNNKYSYAHNVTIENCSFVDPDGTVDCAAIRTEDGGDKNWTVSGCSVDNTMHSLLQVQNIEDQLNVNKCIVNSKNGANLNSTTNLKMSECEFDVRGYAVRFGVNSGGNFGEAKSYVLTDNTLKSENQDGDAVLIFRASAADAVLNLINTTLVGDPAISGINEWLVDGKNYVADGLTKEKDSAEFYVSNAEGLKTLNTMMANKTVGKDVVVNLTTNIDFAGETWTPVDSHADTAFTMKEINGNGHTISNMKVDGQAMFKRFAGSGDVVIKDITFDNVVVDSKGTINTSILTVQSYQNVLLDNVDVTNSAISGGYKVAPLIATVYNEGPSTVTATLKNCDIDNVTVTATKYDFCTAGMVAFVYADDNDKIEFENCTVSNVKLYAPDDSYKAHAAIYTTGSGTLFNEAEGVTVSNVTFEKN